MLRMNVSWNANRGPNSASVIMCCHLLLHEMQIDRVWAKAVFSTSTFPREVPVCKLSHSWLCQDVVCKWKESQTCDCPFNGSWSIWLLSIISVSSFLAVWVSFSQSFIDKYHSVSTLFMLYSAGLSSPTRESNKIPCYRKRALSLAFPLKAAICPIKAFFSPWWEFLFVKDADVQSMQAELKNWGWTWTSRRVIVWVMLVQLEQTLQAAGQLQMDFISSQPLHATLLPVPYLSLPRPSLYYIFFPPAILFLFFSAAR